MVAAARIHPSEMTAVNTGAESGLETGEVDDNIVVFFPPIFSSSLRLRGFIKRPNV